MEDAGAVRAAMASPPISSGAAADRIADALGTPKNVTGEKANATAFVEHRFLDRSLQVDPRAKTDGTLHHPGQIDQVCQHKDLADEVGRRIGLVRDPQSPDLRRRRHSRCWSRMVISLRLRFSSTRRAETYAANSSRVPSTR